MTDRHPLLPLQTGDDLLRAPFLVQQGFGLLPEWFANAGGSPSYGAEPQPVLWTCLGR
ncbi:MAG: hypothetical protein ACWGOW_03095 [Gammaproteobacteria bacterium]